MKLIPFDPMHPLEKAEKITLVQDNLNTHVKASLYQAFPPAGRRHQHGVPGVGDVEATIAFDDGGLHARRGNGLADNAGQHVAIHQGSVKEVLHGAYRRTEDASTAPREAMK